MIAPGDICVVCQEGGRSPTGHSWSGRWSGTHQSEATSGHYSWPPTQRTTLRHPAQHHGNDLSSSSSVAASVADVDHAIFHCFRSLVSTNMLLPSQGSSLGRIGWYIFCHTNNIILLWSLIRPFQNLSVPSSFIAGVIGQRVMQRSNFWGQLWHFGRDVTRKMLNWFFQQLTVIPLKDLNWHVKFEQKWIWSCF